MPGSTEVERSALLGEYADALAACMDGPPGQVGERLVRTFLDYWEDPARGERLAAIFRSAFISEAGAAVLRDFMSAQLYERVASKLNVPPSDLRKVAEMLKVPPLNLNAGPAQVWGVVLLRYILKIEPIASASMDELVDLLAPTIQRYLGGYSVPVPPAR